MQAGDGVEEPLRVSGRVVIPPHELLWRFTRASGPGGQGVNTTDSRVQLRWDAATSGALDEQQRARVLSRLADRLVDGAVTVTSSQERSQLRNRLEARRRLAELVGQALAPPGPARRATRPTRGSVERRIAGKRRRSDVKRLRRGTDD